MLRACLLTLLVAAAFPGFGPAAMAADPTAPATGQTESLKGILQVDFDPQGPYPGGETISAMLTGDALSHKAAANVCKQLKISADLNAFHVSTVSNYEPRRQKSGQLTIEVVFQVPRWDPPLAGPFLAALAEQLQEKLRFSPRNYEEQLRREWDLAGQNLVISLSRIQQLRAAQRKYYQEAGRIDLSRGSIMAEAKALETEGQKLQMDQIGHTARQKALTARIADIALNAERRAEEDPVAAELKKIVALRERELDLAKKRCDAGQMPTSEVGAIEIKVAEARAEWLKRREAAGNLAGRDLLAKLNEELSTIEVDNAETAARLDHIRKQLAKNREILSIADDYQDNLADALRLAEREVQNALQQRSDAERRLRDFVPTTVVAVPSE